MKRSTAYTDSTCNSSSDSDLSLCRPLVENCHFDSSRHSQIEALRSERRSPSLLGKGVEEDRFGKASASQHGNFQLEAGIILYDASTIDQCEWPDHSGIDAERSYLTKLVKGGTVPYFSNISGNVYLLDVEGKRFPLLATEHNYEDSYVSSMFGHYITLGIRSLFIVKRALPRKIATWVLSTLGKGIKRGRINQVVYVNHSLFSTDLQDDSLTNRQVHLVTQFLAKRFPEHAIVFRGVNAECCPNLKKNLKICGYRFLASRQVHISKMTDPSLFHARAVKSDMKLWKEHTFEILKLKDLSKEDEARVLSLYRKVAIEHHSPLNPQITSSFLRLAAESGAMTFKALRKEGVIEGVVGYVNRGKVMTCPIFGYNKDHPESARLYRILSTLLFLDAANSADLFHQSSGATFYKKIRKAESHMEFHSVYDLHLPFKRRTVWTLLRATINTTATSFMKKY